MPQILGNLNPDRSTADLLGQARSGDRVLAPGRFQEDQIGRVGIGWKDRQRFAKRGKQHVSGFIDEEISGNGGVYLEYFASSGPSDVQIDLRFGARGPRPCVLPS